eukprot:6203573-Pleurochrysis_carterae.AAC.1
MAHLLGSRHAPGRTLGPRSVRAHAHSRLIRDSERKLLQGCTLTFNARRTTQNMHNFVCTANGVMLCLPQHLRFVVGANDTGQTAAEFSNVSSPYQHELQPQQFSSRW